MRKSLIGSVLLLVSFPALSAENYKEMTERCFQWFRQVEFNDTAAMRMASDSALFYARKSGSIRLQSSAHCHKGWYYQDLSRFDQALKEFNTALTLSQEAGDELGEADAWCNIGTVRLDKLDYVQAADAQLKALGIYEKLFAKPAFQDSEQRILNGLSSALSNLSTIFAEMKDYAKSIDFQRKSIRYESLKSEKSEVGMAISYHSIGISKYHLSEYDSSEWYLNKALAGYQNARYKQGIGQCYIQLGRVFEKLEHTDEAIAMLRNGLIGAFR
jgi:tetratricopeptide (TPR) repeat protein